MTSLLLILGIIIGILLILIVVIQNPKGGGIASNFTGANQIMGVQRTNDFVEKATWSLAGALLVVALIGSFALSSGTGESIQRSGLQPKIDQNDLQYEQPGNVPAQPDQQNPEDMPELPE